MPKDLDIMELHSALDLLEDYTLNNTLARSQNYRLFQNALDNNVQISSLLIDRLLAVCVHDLQQDKQSSHTILKIINSILLRIKTGSGLTLTNLLPSILGVLNIIKATAQLNTMDMLQVFSFETVLSYPDDVLIQLATMHTNEVMVVLNLYCHDKIPLEIRCLPCELILKLMQVLPKENKITFLKANFKVLFTGLIPTIVSCVQNEALSSEPLETLETLTDVLLHIDYSQDMHWQYVHECIYNPHKYPLLMKNMLEKGSKIWHRLWIVFIRLLKNEITRIVSHGGSPINSMLPVVETAFKMDVTNRCRAFQCWDVLIDNFHTETNEANIVKRVKLLVVPLKSNNAKVEATTLAKLNTWWHLIRRFENRISKFLDAILIPFLHFCFGKYALQNKQPFVPCLLTESTKRRAVEAFIEIAGHLNCNGCVDFPKLSGRLITKKILVDYWNDWMFSLKVVISLSIENINVTQQQITCVWKSFVSIISELPDNNIRKDLFLELLCMLETMVQYSPTNDKMTEVVFNLIICLFEDDKFKALMKSKSEKEESIHKIVSLLMRPSLYVYYKSHPMEYVISKLKLVTNYVMDGNLCIPGHLINWIFSNFTQDSLSFFWTALCETILSLQYQYVGVLESILLWPLQSHNYFVDVEYSSLVWYKLLELLYPKISANVKENINKLLWSSGETTSNLLFMFYASLVMLNDALQKGCGYERPVELLMTVTDALEDYKQIENSGKLLVEIIGRTWNYVIITEKARVGKNAMRCVKNIMKLIIKSLKQDNNESYASILCILLNKVETFLRPSEKMHQSCVPIIADELVNLPLLIKDHESLKKSVLTTMKTCLLNLNQDCAIYNDVKTAIYNMESNDESTNKIVQKNPHENQFTTPDVKIMTRKYKKKETNIVSTVVDNGDEFIVVKSNWKFNPRKLTENQKEKLQRKREDIPALYQDLSQSQDEFKLTSWKTDSQDSSSTNSKSTSASKSTSVEDVTNILKNIPSSDVVPKIIENIFSDNVKKECIEDGSAKATVREDSLKQVSTPKGTKSPRMALKDRVFRNVRNLIEKSGVQKNEKNLSESLIQIENIPKTPSEKIKDNTDLISSAPSTINAERPCRVKRKPKKFDDLEIFALKRNRSSLSQNDSQNEINEPNFENNLLQNSQSFPETLPPNIDDGQCNISNSKTDNQIDEKPIKPSNDNDRIVLEENDDNLQYSAELYNNNKRNAAPVETTDFSVKKNKIASINKDDKLEISGMITDSKALPCATKTASVKNAEVKVSTCEVIPDLIEHDKEADTAKEKNYSNDIVKTPKAIKKQVSGNHKSTAKKSEIKKSRIEKELEIDTVEGHPILKNNSEQRVTRKNIMNTLNNSRRKSIANKLNKSKSNTLIRSKMSTPNTKKKDKERTSNDSATVTEVVTVNDSQEISKTNSDIAEDFPLSEDIIESSQDSSITTIPATTTKSSNKKLSVVIERYPIISSQNNTDVPGIQANIELDADKSVVHQKYNGLDKDDSDFPENKTISQKSDFDSTENMDTEPIDDKIINFTDKSSDVIIINDDDEFPIVINTDDTCVGSETQEIAEADTLPTDSTQFMNGNKMTETDVNLNDIEETVIEGSKEKKATQKEEEIDTDSGNTKTYCESFAISPETQDEVNTVSSPFKDEEQRKKDFLNNTVEISPIKTMSPVKEKKSSSPETSNDYVVITLSSPVHINGEPFEKSDSPEIFTEEKISPDKRDLSPPRESINGNTNSSPSSLSLKKNKPQVRSGRRAAQMLGLCVPDRLQAIISNERPETEEPKKVSPSSTPARRNLRILYNSVGDNNESSEVKADSENFLKFERSLPTSDCSPSGPILKRKLAEIIDDATITPTSKRKRVSFHDPPVSTTVSVQKYIEPCGIRSPQNTALKRQERQNLRTQTVLKSSKRLDNVFKLDSVLTKAVESFTELELSSTEDAQSMSLDETPAVEIVKNSDLNDVDPICPELVDCTDPIEVIANHLSSATMKAAFLKKIEGKLATVGDLAKMTELGVNRLCIKAPKVKTAKKILSDYYIKKAFEESGPKEVAIVNVDDNEAPEATVDGKIDNEAQTEDIALKNTDMQTDVTVLTAVSVQTDDKEACHKNVQTEESGNQSTKDIIAKCVIENPDFIEQLGHNLEELSKLKIADTLSFKAFTKGFMKRVTSDNSKTLITEILERQNNADSENGNGILSFLQDYMCERFGNSDLILFCSQLLAKIHNRPS